MIMNHLYLLELPDCDVIELWQIAERFCGGHPKYFVVCKSCERRYRVQHGSGTFSLWDVQVGRCYRTPDGALRHLFHRAPQVTNQGESPIAGVPEPEVFRDLVDEGGDHPLWSESYVADQLVPELGAVLDVPPLPGFWLEEGGPLDRASAGRREKVVQSLFCEDNLGMEDSFDVGVEYEAASGVVDGYVRVFDRFGEAVEAKASRFSFRDVVYDPSPLRR